MHHNQLPGALSQVALPKDRSIYSRGVARLDAGMQYWRDMLEVQEDLYRTSICCCSEQQTVHVMHVYVTKV